MSSNEPSVPVREAYQRLGRDAVARAFLFGSLCAVPAFMAFRKPSMRTFCTGVGFGSGIGWSAKQADTYFRTLDPVELPAEAPGAQLVPFVKNLKRTLLRRERDS